MITLMMTLTKGQGHKGQGQRSEKETLACFSETWHVSRKNGKGHIKATIKQT